MAIAKLLEMIFLIYARGGSHAVRRVHRGGRQQR
jgi:hypothetical protein